MATNFYGGNKYEGAFVIEHEGLLFGPFDSISDATEFAMKTLDIPWTLRDLLTSGGQHG